MGSTLPPPIDPFQLQAAATRCMESEIAPAQAIHAVQQEQRVLHPPTGRRAISFVQCWEVWDGVEPGAYVPLEPPPPPSACADCGRHEDSLSGQEDDARIDGQDGVFYCGPCADVRRNAFIDELIRSVRERRSVREGAVCM